MRLTKLQREILTLLDNGSIMQIDGMNLASIDGRDIASQTRYFLTDKKLVTRLDKKRKVEAKGNGFVISDKGKRLLTDQASRTSN